MWNDKTKNEITEHILKELAIHYNNRRIYGRQNLLKSPDPDLTFMGCGHNDKLNCCELAMRRKQMILWVGMFSLSVY